jgi:predicted rRNA methylase YqxC with S4 and FtsJ domains
VAERIRTDRRVHILERTNLRHLSCLPELVDITTLDLSFISILMVLTNKYNNKLLIVCCFILLIYWIPDSSGNACSLLLDET